jgi:hypothetical protein
MSNKIVNTKAHLKTIGIMSMLLGLMGSIITWPRVMLKVMVAGTGIAFLALIYYVIYSIVKTRDLDNRDRDNYGDYR